MEGKGTHIQLFILFISISVYLESYLCTCTVLLMVWTDGRTEGGGSGVTLVLAATEPGVPEPENGLRFSKVKPTLPLPQRTTCTCSLKDAWTAARVCAMSF